MKEHIALTGGKSVKINDPDFDTLQELSDHDLLIVLYTQMTATRNDVKEMKKSFSGKWVERVMVFVIIGVGGGIITAGTNVVVKAIGGQ